MGGGLRVGRKLGPWCSLQCLGRGNGKSPAMAWSWLMLMHLSSPQHATVRSSAPAWCRPIPHRPACLNAGLPAYDPTTTGPLPRACTHLGAVLVAPSRTPLLGHAALPLWEGGRHGLLDLIILGTRIAHRAPGVRVGWGPAERLERASKQGDGPVAKVCCKTLLGRCRQTAKQADRRVSGQAHACTCPSLCSTCSSPPCVRRHSPQLTPRWRRAARAASCPPPPCAPPTVRGAQGSPCPCGAWPLPHGPCPC